MKLLLLMLIPIIALSQATQHIPEKIDTLVPKGYYLERYYPIPFSPVTWTYFGLPDSCNVRMTIRDSTNQVNVDTIFIGNLASGNYKYNFRYFAVKLNRNKRFKGYLYVEADSFIPNGKTYFISSSRFGWP